MSVNIRRVGVELWSGAESMGYELTSDLVSITVADLGAHLVSVVLRVDDGELPVSVDYPPDAVGPTGSHGATIGRYANRIAGAAFDLDGVHHRLEPNEGPNQLHGGPVGFSSHAWSADAEQDGDTGRVVLRHTSKAGDMGFPGKVKAEAEFSLSADRLTVEYRASSDAPTPINLTNHVYWNLGGDGVPEGHRLQVAADAYVAVDEANIPVPGPPASVRGTRFNCNDGRDLDAIVDAGGYDHCFVLAADASPKARLQHVSGRAIEVDTDQIGLQVYTGRHLAPGRWGVALETQFPPDTPNRPDFGDCTLRPGDPYRSSTTFTFRV